VKPVAVVTGSTSGIGLAIGERLLNDGFQLIVVGRRPAEEALSAYKQAKVDGALLRYERADLGDPDDTARLIDVLRPFTPRVLVHAAGQCPEASADDPKAARQELLELCDLHAGSALQLALGLAPAMAAGAHIILLSSTATRRVAPQQMAYAASKGALDVLCRHLAVALKPRICVNAFAPGLVRTPMSARAFGDAALLERVTTNTPLGRLASADDIAAAVLALVRMSPCFMTGEVMTVDGGNHIPW
jgi:NAD(P)-dependent dehydrogenase (short-subunit alcohol dehydrogenase family)